MKSEKDPADRSGEAVIAEIPVSARLVRGEESLRLVLTTRRLIVAHRGKRGAGALAASSLLGDVSGRLESMVKGEGGSLKKAASGKVDPEEVLKADKDNFQITFDELVLAELTGSRSGVGIMVVTRDDKFQFSASAGLETVEPLFREALGSKMSVVQR